MIQTYDLSAPLQGSGYLRMWFDNNSTAGTELFGFSYQAEKTKKVYFDNYFASVNKSLEAVHLKVIKFQFQIGAQIYLNF